MTLTRRQFLAGTVALPAVLALKQGRREHEWVFDGDFCKRCGVPVEAVIDGKWPNICDEPYRHFVEWQGTVQRIPDWHWSLDAVSGDLVAVPNA